MLLLWEHEECVAAQAELQHPGLAGMGAPIVLTAWKCHASLTFNNLKNVLLSPCIKNIKRLNFLSLSTLKSCHFYSGFNALVLANPVGGKHLSHEQKAARTGPCLDRDPSHGRKETSHFICTFQQCLLLAIHSII